jgi:hypothetical protein
MIAANGFAGGIGVVFLNMFFVAEAGCVPGFPAAVNASWLVTGAGEVYQAGGVGGLFALPLGVSGFINF